MLAAGSQTQKQQSTHNTYFHKKILETTTKGWNVFFGHYLQGQLAALTCHPTISELCTLLSTCCGIQHTKTISNAQKEYDKTRICVEKQPEAKDQHNLLAIKHQGAEYLSEEQYFKHQESNAPQNHDTYVQTFMYKRPSQHAYILIVYIFMATASP